MKAPKKTVKKKAAQQKTPPQKVFCAATFPDPLATLILEEMARTGEHPAAFLRRVVSEYYHVTPPAVTNGGYRHGQRKTGESTE